jgi:hypothetical protein
VAARPLRRRANSQATPIHVQDVPERSLTPQTYRVHAVDDSGRWAWILGNRFLAQLNRDRCLDGSPLPGRT